MGVTGVYEVSGNQSHFSFFYVLYQLGIGWGVSQKAAACLDRDSIKCKSPVLYKYLLSKGYGSYIFRVICYLGLKWKKGNCSTWADVVSGVPQGVSFGASSSSSAFQYIYLNY